MLIRQILSVWPREMDRAHEARVPVGPDDGEEETRIGCYARRCIGEFPSIDQFVAANIIYSALVIWY